MQVINWRRGWIFGSIAVAIAVAAIPLVAGFDGIEVFQAGETRIYRGSIGLVVVFLASGMAMLSMGIAIITVPHLLFRLLGFLGIAGALMIVVTAPTSLAQSLVITSEGFDHTIGFWWRPETTSVRFDEVASLAIVSYRDKDGLSTVRLECAYKDGRRTTIPGSDLLKAGLAHISVRAVIKDVPVSTTDEDSY